jgi:asparagine synthase (glutamine-hydrolysing)
VKRLLAGVFDPGGRHETLDPGKALAPEAASGWGAGPLRLACSGPPPPVADGVLCLLDGHLDNAVELGAELDVEAPGSAEELLARAYRRWGESLVARMRGDFTLLLWDEERGEGLIARDQLGLRPLFVQRRGDSLLFAGEIRRLLALLPRRPEPDAASVVHWLLAGNQPGRRTLFNGVCRLQPGTLLLLERRGFRERRYWQPRFEGPLELPADDLVARLRSALDRAVARQSSATGPTGVLMSGGLDSSSLAALGAAQAPGRVFAYSATFPEHPAVDEAELIGELRSSLDLPGATAEVRPGGLLASALEHLEAWQMPLLGWGDFWSLPLARAARSDGIETMLDGTGGDELFGPFSYLLADRLRAGHPRQVISLAYGLPGGGPHVPRRQVAAVIGSLGLAGALPYWPHRRLQRMFAARQAPGWLSRASLRSFAQSDDSLAWKRLEGPRWWARTAHGVAHEIEASGVFENQSRWAASAGFEVRMPLLDLDLVELALRQPPRGTFDQRFSRPLLRAAMAGSLPDAVRLRPAKAWFDSLVVDCLAGADGAAVRSVLGDPQAEIGAYVDLAKMQAALLDADRQRRDDPLAWMSQVWRLLTAELWLRAQVSPVSALRRDLRPSPARIEIGLDSHLSST